MYTNSSSSHNRLQCGLPLLLGLAAAEGRSCAEGIQAQALAPSIASDTVKLSLYVVGLGPCRLILTDQSVPDSLYHRSISLLLCL